TRAAVPRLAAGMEHAMRTALCRVLPGLLLVAIAAADRAAGMDIVVPSLNNETIQKAVANLAPGNDPDNTIFIAQPSIDTNTKIEFDMHFNCGPRLVIRPDPTLARAQIRSTDIGIDPIIAMLPNSGGLTFQDLD